MAKNDCRPLPELSEKDIQRFWSKVDKTPGQGPKGDCWPWTSGVRGKGYGQFHTSGYNFAAHRVALFLNTGIDPYPLLACHSCDWKPCCNGSHLFPGTCRDNLADAAKKGLTCLGDKHGLRIHPELSAKGESVNTAKLTVERVRDLRERYSHGGVSQYQLAREFEITQGQVSAIIRREFWRHC